MIGIFGGTFDPVHYGHIKPALHIMQVLSLTQLRFIPNRQPPHRETPWLSVETRLQLLQCVAAEYPQICIDSRELKREGASYMVDTLASLQQDFSRETLVLIIGMDAFAGINHWHEWRMIFDYCHLVVTMRPGYDLDSVARQMKAEDFRFLGQRITSDRQGLSDTECGRILLQSVPQLDISATRIRLGLQRGEDISAWVPACVATCLMRNQTDDD